MKNNLVEVSKAARTIHNTLVGKDYYFVENISLCNIGAYPAFMTKLPNSTGSVTYTSELNTYFSPSFAFLAKHHASFKSVINSLVSLIQEIQKEHKRINVKYEFPREFYAHFSKAFAGSVGNYDTDLTNSLDINVKYYKNVDTYFDEKTSHHQPYLIDIFNFKDMELKGDYKSMFDGAMIAKALFSQFDFLVYAAHGESSFLQEEISKLIEISRGGKPFIIDFHLENLLKNMKKLEDNILTEYEHYESKEKAL